MISERVAKLMLVLSIFNPVVVGQITLFQFLFWPVAMVFALALFVSRVRIVNIPLFLVIHMFICSVLSSVAVSFYSERIDSSSLVSSLGGIESYITIYLAWLFAVLTKAGLNSDILENLVVRFVSPLVGMSILFFILSPSMTTALINKVILGYENSGQWRFSSFFGLPYYAGIAYVTFLLFTFHHFSSGIIRGYKKAYYAGIVVLLLIGGVLAASKTFFAGIFAVISYLLISGRFSVKAVFIYILGCAFIIGPALVIWGANYLSAFNDLGQVLKLVLLNLSDPLGAVIFRYSGDNTAVSSVFDNDNWNWLFGVGLHAQQVATDSQYRDVFYRFGFVGACFLFILVVVVAAKVESRYRVLLVALSIGALGSNSFTPINLTFAIWYLLFMNFYRSGSLRTCDPGAIDGASKNTGEV